MTAGSVAIIGISGVYPDADDLGQFYLNLVNGVDSVRQVSAQRKAYAGLDPAAPCYPIASVEHIDRFDHEFFGISLKEAEYMDPQQRLLLQLACAAIEDAGYSLKQLRGSRTATIVSASNSDYSKLFEEFDPSMVTGQLPGALAGRIAYSLDLHGPAMVIDTACSSSLLAIHEAYRKVSAGQVDYAIAGGINIYFVKDGDYEGDGSNEIVLVGINSPDGKCKTFDESANGAGWGEGGGLVLLKRLDQALIDRDHIHAVIKGGGVNQDGGRSNGLAAPSPHAQRDVILEAWKDAGIAPSTISYLEAHGTGTELGDPIEIQGITDAFRQFTDRKQFCGIGALKTNIGHLSGAAGIAGLTKLILSLQHRQIFPSLHFHTPNPFIDFDNSPVFVNAQLRDWVVAEEVGVKRAGISSFGLSGTNVHLVLEEAPAEGAIRSSVQRGGQTLITLSAKTPSALRRYLSSLAEFLKHSDETIEIGDIGYTLNLGRNDYHYRYAQAVSDRRELIEHLEHQLAQPADPEDSKPGKADRSLVFLLPGDTEVRDQLIGTLNAQYPAFKSGWDRCQRNGTSATLEPNVKTVTFLYSLYHAWTALGLSSNKIIGTGIGNIAVAIITGRLGLREGLSQAGEYRGTQVSPDPAKLKMVLDEIRRTTNPLFLEFGQNTELAKQIGKLESELPIVRSLNGNDDLLPIAAQLYMRGANIDWEKFYERSEHRRVKLPTYPFEQTSCWISKIAAVQPLKTQSQAQPVAESYGQLAEESNETERKLAAIWGEVLKVKTLTLDDDFFDLGGNSLDGTQIISRVKESFDVKIEFEVLYDYPRLTSLSQHIDSLRPVELAPQEMPAADEPGDSIPSNAGLVMSSGQERLWFLDQLEPGKTFYNLPYAIAIEGLLDVAALDRSLKEVLRRHEVLRGIFSNVDGHAISTIDRSLTLNLPVIDLRELSAPENQRRAEELTRAEARRAFDLSRGPLLRVSLLWLTDDRYILLLTMHHIVADRWSIQILIKELAALYDAYSQGQASSLPALPIQYADYAMWQQQWLQGDEFHEQLRYWKQQLSDTAQVLQLPTDHPRPPVPSFRSAHESLVISKELTAALKQLSRGEEVTLFMLVLAALQSLLHRYSQQQQISIGTPLAGRTRTETESLIGFFVNTLVLRTNFAGDPSFAQLLRRVKAVALGAYAHQEVPFEKLVEELDVERSLSHTPLFQVMFAMQNMTMPSLRLPQLELELLETESGTTQFDIVLFMTDTGETLLAHMDYSTDLFEAATIRRMLAHFERMLTEIVADPQQRVSRLPLLSEAEREQVLVQWNQTTREFPEQQCVHELIEEQAARQPNAVAVICGDERLTYGELNQRANQLAHYLKSLGVGADSIVGVSLERSLEMMVALLGILKAGGAYLPLDPEYPAERLHYMIEDAGVAVVLTTEQFTDIDAQPRENLRLKIHPENLAYVIYTSGSTGRPKGVMIPHRNLLNFLSSMRAQPGLQESDLLLAVTTFSFDIAALELWLPLMAGARLLLAESWRAADPVALSELLRASRATVMQATPVTWRMLLDAGWRGGKEFKVLCGGEALSRTLAAELVASSESVWNLYGPTETTIWSTQQAVWELGEELAEAGVVPLGRPLANTQVYVLDGQMRVMPVGVVGELYIGGAGVARGYLGRAELTAEKFMPDPYGAAGGRLYRTGDLVRHRPDGNLEFIGRRDEQVKVRGFRIELGEVEAAIAKCPGVKKAIALVRSVNQFDKRLAAYVVAEAGADVSVRAIREQLKSRLPDYMTPTDFLLLDELPLTPNGKIDRRALAALEPGSSPGKDFEAPRTPVEEMLAGVWAELLSVERVGVTDNFFELGGHSLLATQLVSRVREVFQVEIPLRSLFEGGTLGDLAQKIEDELRSGDGLDSGTIVPIARDGKLPLSFAQQRLWFLDQLEPGTIAYNMPVAVQLGGPLDISALERALNEVIKRHEVLRTSFGVVDGEPVQIIAEAESSELSLIDISDMPELERTQKVRQFAVEEGLRPFALSEGNLLRVGLLRLSAEDHVLLLTMHHIVSDGWSMGVLVREVSTLYYAYAAGRPSPLEELKIQYVDFAHWQREWLSGEVLGLQLNYWREQLAGSPPVLELPTDRPRPAMQTLNGASETVWLPAELSSSMKELSRQEGATLFMTLLAGFQLLLSRYSGQTDIVVGSAIANRQRAEIEPLIGFFINSLVLRTRFDDDPSFRELLSRVRETALGAYAHQDLPFEMLVEHLHPQRDLSRSPLFQVMFTLQTAPHQAVTLNETALTVTPLESPTAAAKFDFEINASDLPEGLALSCEYNTDLFDATTISRMLAHFGNLLDAAVADPGRRISELSLLTEEEQRQLLVKCNGPAVPIADSDSFDQLFTLQAQRTPESVALSCGPQRFTYNELSERVNRAAQRLAAFGVRRETVIGLLCERSMDWVTAVLAILRSGGVYLPLEARHPAARLGDVVGQSGARVVVVGDGLEAKMDEALDGSDDVRVVSLAGLLSEDSALDQHHNLTGAEPSQLAYIIFTSGSTGAPKGAMIEQRGMLNHLVAKIRDLELKPDDCIAQTASPGFDISVWQMLAPLVVGGRVEVIPDDLAHDPVALLNEVEGAGVSVLELVPSMLRAVVQQLRDPGAERRPQFEKLRWLMVTGEVLEAELCRQWLAEYAHVPLVNAYGPTECSDDVTHEMVFVRPAKAEREAALGHVLNNLRIYVLNARGEILAEGVWGELYVGGAGVARGYVGRADLTAERFVPDEYGEEAGARLYRTGDIGRWRRGKLEYGGRVDEQVKVRGQRIELGEIESVLSGHESVRECAVVVRDDLEGHKRLAAYVVPQGSREQSDEQERRKLEAEKVQQWEEVFDGVYRETELSKRDAGVNLKVWTSSYTREPLPEADIFECVEDSVSRILRLQPKRLLELGCGTGLLLTRIAPNCDYYCGTDISTEVVRSLRERVVSSNGQLPDVDLHVRAAHDFAGLPAASFDVVVINELVQYFPSVDYLVQVLEGALTMVQPGGCVFVGGVRNLKLLEAFHLSVLLHQSPAELPIEQLRQSLRKHVAQEKELVIDPDFFRVLKERYPSISDVHTELKGGTHDNELTKFRYDVVLRVGSELAASGEYVSTDWERDRMSLTEVKRMLRQQKPALLGISNVSNERVSHERRALELLASDQAPATAGELRRAAEEANGIQPHQFWSIAEQMPYTVDITWSGEGNDFSYDVLMRHGEREGLAGRNGKPQLAPPQTAIDDPQFSWRQYANNPLREGVGEQLVPLLRRYLKERVPEYMVPASFTILDHLPLTPNGKLDRRALPAPDTTRHDPEQTYVVPSTTTEDILARVWCEVLGLEQVGIHDNFFVLGGDSILSIQIVSRAARAGLHLTPKDLFQHQTVAALAAVVRTSGAVAAEQGIVTGDVQLTPVQHWFFERQMTDPHHYNQAVMLEVRDIDATLLGRIVTKLAEHHDALRLRFEQTQQGWRQWSVAEESEVFSRINLSESGPVEQTARIEALASEIQASLNLQEGPVIRVVLVELGTERGQRLLIVIHHLAVDGVSWRILLEDLQSAYEQLSSGAEIQLPAKTTSFKEWAQQIKKYAQLEALESEASHWLDPQRLLVAPLPLDHPAGENTQASTRVVSLALTADETRQLLHDVPGVYHTQIDDVLLTALGRAISGWTRQEQVLVDLEGHGREPIDEAVDVTRTVGWFTAIYPVLLKSVVGAPVGEALKSVKEQLRAVPERGIGYGLLRYLRGDDELSQKLRDMPESQLSFNYLGQLDQVLTTGSGFTAAREASGESRSANGRREYVLDVVAGISEEQLQLSWVYSERLHRHETIERVAADCVKELRQIIAHCKSPEAGGFTPSDFPYADLDQEALDRVMAKFATNRRG